MLEISSIYTPPMKTHHIDNLFRMIWFPATRLFLAALNRGDWASESIVDAETDQVRRQSIAGSGQPVKFAAEVEVEIFGPCGPVLSEPYLQAGATGPAAMEIVLLGAADNHMAATIGKPQRAVEQDFVHGVTGTPAHRPDPGIGEFVVGEGVACVGKLEVRFGAQHELSELPVVAALEAARDAVRFGAAVRERSPSIADIGTEIWPHPTISECLLWVPRPIGRGAFVNIRRARRGHHQRQHRRGSDQACAHIPLQ